MKIKAFASLCRKNKRVYLYTEEDRQWISDGLAAYSLDGVPWLSPEHVPVLLDVPEKDRSSYDVKKVDSPEDGLFSDHWRGEEAVMPMNANIRYKEMDLLVFRVFGELWFLQEKYLPPVLDDFSCFYARKAGKRNIIAVKNGLLLAAVISCCNPVDGKLADEMQEISIGCTELLRKKEQAWRQTSDESDKDQISLQYEIAEPVDGQAVE